jgi:ribonuclease VapC
VNESDESVPTVVLDASALLAYLHAEPGGERVGEMLQRSLISSVNWSEVLQKALSHAVDIEGLERDLVSLGMRIVDFDAGQAEAAARLWSATKGFGLSLADRACLGLAKTRDLEACTADRSWIQVSSSVRLIR